MKVSYVTAIVSDGRAIVHSRHVMRKDAEAVERRDPRLSTVRLTTLGQQGDLRDPTLGETLDLLPLGGADSLRAAYPKAKVTIVPVKEATPQVRLTRPQQTLLLDIRAQNGLRLHPSYVPGRRLEGMGLIRTVEGSAQLSNPLFILTEKGKEVAEQLV